MNYKKTIRLIFLFSAVLLLVLPVVTTLNEGLTRIVEQMFWYKWLKLYIVPYEAKILAGVLKVIPGISVAANIRGIELNGTQIFVTWNCIGWQSFVLFVLSLFAGFGKGYTRSTQFQAFLFGICGLFLINVTRLLITALLAVYAHSLFMVVFHNYLASFMSLGWLFFFWWFSYKFVLEEKTVELTPTV